MSQFKGIALATSCEWVLSTADNEHEFCGADPTSPHSYCAEHLALAYRTDTEKVDLKPVLDTDAEPGELSEEDLKCVVAEE